jgi:2-dehydropantoate 2-reductase
MTARRFAILGTGGIGGFYGARLAASGLDVTFVGRSDVEVLRRDGLHVTSPLGDIDLPTVRATDEPSAVGPVDVVVVTLKTTANDRLAELVGPLVGPGTVVVSMQNGFGVDEQLAAAAPGATVLGALCFICSTRVAPGRIEHLDYGRVTLGELGVGGAPAGITSAMRDLIAELEAAGIEVAPRDDLIAARWQKLMWNVPFNGLSVVLDAGTDELVGDPGVRALAIAMMDEIAAAAEAHGHPVGDGFGDRMVRNTETMVPYAPSMKLDFDAGRPMELAAIYDAPLAVAASLGVEMPHVETVAAQLHLLDARASRHP